MWKELQQRFRLRLQHIRAQQIAAVVARSCYERRLWEYRLEQARKWRRYCEDRACPGCGGLTLTEGRINGWDSLCICKHKPKADMLAKWLRQLAGFNGGSKRITLGSDWKQFSGGSTGGKQVCGPSQWDNVVRASEEDA